MKVRIRGVALTLAALVGVVALAVRWAHAPVKGYPSQIVPADTALRQSWLYFYPSHRPGRPAAVVALFGNDVAFWEPHQAMAWRLADDGYSVIGIDLRKFLATLPGNEPQRDSAFGVAMPAIIARARHELGGDDLPLILGGHSFGAEIAIWLAANKPPEHLIGVLALNTRGSGHLFITTSDWLNHEPSGPWSFSTIDAVRRIEPRVRIALVRGSKDPFRDHDPAFLAAGGARIRRFEVPMAGHSLKTLLIAGPIISRAVRFLTDSAR
jgi:pimeloyl-ACP methyl ester carboxylesterase